MLTPSISDPLADLLFDPLAPAEPFIGTETDRHGNEVVPPNFFQLKHAQREKDNTFKRLWNEIQLAGIDWEEFIAYVDSNPQSDGDKLRKHRLRNANIKKNVEALKAGRKRAGLK